MEHDPSRWTAAGGGARIACAASRLPLCDGRLAGVSGILAGLLRPDARARPRRVAFVAGLRLGGGALAVVAPEALGAPRAAAGLAPATTLPGDAASLRRAILCDESCRACR